MALGESILDILPDILSKKKNSVIKRYTESHTEEVEQYKSLLQDIRNSHYIEKADKGTKASGTVEITLDEDAVTTIEEGTVIGTQPNARGEYKKFFVTEDTDVGSAQATYWNNNWGEMSWASGTSTSTITVDVPIEAEEAGTAYNLSAGEITYLPDEPPGFQSATNPQATTGGKIDQLDRIGALFGTLGRRNGRSDAEYRAYLKSIVAAFGGKGTIPSIKSAIGAGINIDESKISINEHYQDIEYSIILNDWTNHRVSTVETLAELSDASVSRLRKTSYRNDEDVGVGEVIQVTEGSQYQDDMAVDDTIAVNRVASTESSGISESIAVNRAEATDGEGVTDSVVVDGNKYQFQDEYSVDDSVAVDGNKTDTGTDGAGVDDGVSYSTNKVDWDTNDWGTMTWAPQH